MKTLLVAVFSAGVVGPLGASELTCDMTGYQATPGLEARVEQDALLVQWKGEAGQELRASFASREEMGPLFCVGLRRQRRVHTAGAFALRGERDRLGRSVRRLAEQLVE